MVEGDRDRDDLLGAVVARERLQAGAHLGGIADDRTAPGWFDDPDAPSPKRTTGGYVRVEDLAGPDAAAVLAAARRLSAELEIVVEVQWRERCLGEITAGRPAGALATLIDEPG